MPVYSELPTINQWRRDTIFPNERKGDDPILARIDFLVEEIHTNPAGYDPGYLYGELYFATVQWLKGFKVNPQMKTRTQLEAAIHNLFVCVVNRLAYCLTCTVNVLPNRLEVLYGQDMAEHGDKVDGLSFNVGIKSHYMQRSAANQFKVFFMKGLAYQFEYNTRKPKLVPADSSVWWKNSQECLQSDPNALGDDWCMFVMSMGRDIYAGPHMFPDKHPTLGLAELPHSKIESQYIRERKVARYHSSWLGGTPVQCAGTMKIEKGIVKKIRNNSGHYAPPAETMERVIDLLRTVGQEVKNIEVYGFHGELLGRGDEARAGKGWALQKVA